jgi:hypothetical protein
MLEDITRLVREIQQVDGGGGEERKASPQSSGALDEPVELDGQAAGAADGDDEEAEDFILIPKLLERSDSSLTVQEEAADEAAMLSHVMKLAAAKEGRPDVRKSNVGIMLRQQNPAIFSNRDVIKEFVARAIDPNGLALLEESFG